MQGDRYGLAALLNLFFRFSGMEIAMLVLMHHFVDNPFLGGGIYGHEKRESASEWRVRPPSPPHRILFGYAYKKNSGLSEWWAHQARNFAYSFT